ncbi:MAG TPA: glycosyltransferase [Acetobacteraceae bacterium]|nr:glycosyltransferase [Acetobacteraceae bacterium]
MSGFTEASSPPPPGQGCAAASRETRAGTPGERPLPLSAIIPTLNAARVIGPTLATLAGQVAEIIIADGGSTDDIAALAAAAGARLVPSPRGRGPQIAAGVAASTQPWVLILHADTRPGAGWAEAVARFMADPAMAHRAGHFRFALDDPAPEARRLERWVARRCRWFALPYGDQGLLIRRVLLDEVGGVRPLVLMEDVDLVRRLGRARLAPLDVPFITSAERWRAEGWRRRSARNLLCLALWFAGVPPARIARIYGRRR